MQNDEGAGPPSTGPGSQQTSATEPEATSSARQATVDTRHAGRFDWEQRLRDDRSLDSRARTLGFLLATYASPDGTRVSPGVVLVMEITGQSKRTVLRQLDALRTSGWIERVSRADRSRGRSDSYRLTVPCGLQREQSQHPSPLDHGAVATPDQVSPQLPDDEGQVSPQLLDGEGYQVPFQTASSATWAPPPDHDQTSNPNPPSSGSESRSTSIATPAGDSLTRHTPVAAQTACGDGAREPERDPATGAFSTAIARRVGRDQDQPRQDRAQLRDVSAPEGGAAGQVAGNTSQDRPLVAAVPSLAAPGCPHVCTRGLLDPDTDRPRWCPHCKPERAREAADRKAARAS